MVLTLLLYWIATIGTLIACIYMVYLGYRVKLAIAVGIIDILQFAFIHSINVAGIAGEEFERNQW